MAPGANELTDHFLQKAATSAKRMVWMTRPGDKIVTPTSLSTPFLEYVARVRGDLTLVDATSPVTSVPGRPLPLNVRMVADGSLLAEELAACALDGSVEQVHPYIADTVSMAFACRVGAKSVSFCPGDSTARPVVTAHLNEKTEFRQFARLLGVPIAAGVTVSDEPQLIESVSSLLRETGSVIVKMGRFSSGEGNLIVNSPGSSNVLGAATSVSISDVHDGAIMQALRSAQIKVSKQSPVVVEAYYTNELCFGLHYIVENRGPTLRGAAEQINGPTVCGQFWGANILAEVPHDVRAWSRRLADYAHVIGYRGPLSVDIVKGRSIGYIATEVNGRHGGFSTVRSLIESIGLVQDVEDGNRVALIHHGLTINGSFQEAVVRLSEDRLHYDAKARRGAVIMTEGYLDQGPYDIVIVGQNWDDAKALETKLVEIARG